MDGLATNLETYLNASWMLALLVAFAGGLVASLTPCVYPLIPITASFVSSQSAGAKSRWRAFSLSSVYVTGLAVAYAGLGMFAALSGSFFGSISTNPWTFLVVGVVISMFALYMMEILALPIPKFLSGTDGASGRGGFLGAFILGFSSGFVAGPCTAPVLGVLLTYSATVGNPVFGFALLFVFSLGMGVLLIVVGTFSGIVGKLPKSGLWMVRVKLALGVLMLAVGDYFIFMAGRQWL